VSLQLVQRITEGREDMRSTRSTKAPLRIVWILPAVIGVCFFTTIAISAPQSASSPATAAASGGAKTFSSPQQAADVLIDAADKFDQDALIGLVGRGNSDLIQTGDSVQDRERARQFSALAQEKKTVSVDPKTHNRAVLSVGKDDWPFPIPIVKAGDKWSFDANAGRKEILARRIGGNELDAIALCRGFVDAQYEYAQKPREGYDVNQYAQHIISTPGKQDGLAWQDPDGTWHGPAGESVARAIQAGYSKGSEPYHGYFFKALTAQGPAAPLGAMNYIVKGAMIGGFALAAAPAEYGKTGIQTFIVGYDGVVYQKNVGPKTLEEFQKMQLYNPDKSWTPVKDEDDN